MGDTYDQVYEEYDDFRDEEDDTSGREITFVPYGESPKAWLIRIREKKVWLPKSVCVVNESRTKIFVPNWLLSQHE